MKKGWVGAENRATRYNPLSPCGLSSFWWHGSRQPHKPKRILCSVQQALQWVWSREKREKNSCIKYKLFWQCMHIHITSSTFPPFTEKNPTRMIVVVDFLPFSLSFERERVIRTCDMAIILGTCFYLSCRNIFNSWPEKYIMRSNVPRLDKIVALAQKYMCLKKEDYSTVVVCPLGKRGKSTHIFSLSSHMPKVKKKI